VVVEGKAKADGFAKCWQALRPGAAAHRRAAEIGERYRQRPGAGSHEEIVRRVEGLVSA
jgi:hypothetical protein